THYLLSYGLNTLQLGILRLSGAFVLTLLIAAVLGRIRVLSIRQWAWLAAIGLACQALSSVSFASAVAGAGSSLAIIMLCMGPLFTAAINRFLYGEHLDSASRGLILLGLIGLALTVLYSQGEQPRAALFGKQWFVALGWGLLSGLCYGLFPILTNALGPLDSWVTVSFSLGLGTVFLAPLQGTYPVLTLPTDVSAWLLIAALILVPTVIADVLYVRAIAIGGPMLATVFALIEVPASVLYAWWWLAVPLVPAQWAGIFLFCLGLAGLALRRNQRPVPTTEPVIISPIQTEKHYE
ncbi:DMT family transporter, partial [Serratia fonticola]